AAMKVCIGLILAILATSCLCRPAAPGPAKDPHQLPARLLRRDWPESLSQEQKLLLSQFLPHILAGDSAHGAEGLEALHELYYPDWMDFGRRSAEEPLGAA
ncbi:ANTR protein, partial [Centropus bengalensis]|nr:ANTR protein [Centropus unirufus]NXX99029.1 ANTR protein [Centropus bengalensis]